MHIYYINIYIYIYIERERERERDKETCVHISIQTYMYYVKTPLCQAPRYITPKHGTACLTAPHTRRAV